MKTFKILFVLLFFIIISCKKENTSNENSKTKEVSIKKDKSIENPEKVGNQIFEVLKDIDKKTIEDYEKQVITYQEFNDLASNPSAKLGDYRNEFKSITPEMFAEVTTKDLKNIQTAGKNYNIDWSTIAFSEFIHEVYEFDGIKGLKGELHFKNKDGKIYFVKSQSFYNGKGYQIIKVAEIEQKR